MGIFPYTPVTVHMQVKHDGLVFQRGFILLCDDSPELPLLLCFMTNTDVRQPYAQCALPARSMLLRFRPTISDTVRFSAMDLDQDRLQRRVSSRPCPVLEECYVT